MVLVRNNLTDVTKAFLLSRKTIRNIHQNLFWAFFYNTLGIPLAIGLLTLFGGPGLSPMFAAFAMSMSSVFVVTNALRLNRFKEREKSIVSAGLPNGSPALLSRSYQTLLDGTII